MKQGAAGHFGEITNPLLTLMTAEIEKRNLEETKKKKNKMGGDKDSILTNKNTES